MAVNGVLMEQLFSSRQWKPFLAFLCAAGWSLAYPLIKLGYAGFQIPSADLGGKILFAGVRFLAAGLLIMCFCKVRRIPLGLEHRRDYRWVVLLGVVNTTLHYMFAYIGLGFNASARSTILDSMGVFILIVLSTLLLADDHMTLPKAAGCLLGIAGIVVLNVEPGGDFFADISMRGDGMILLNAIFSAFGGLITRSVSEKMHIMPATGQSMALGGGLLLLTGLLIGRESPWTVTWRGVLILYGLILISAVCFAVYNELLAHHPVSGIAIYNALIPVLGVFFAALILGEPLKWQYMIAVLAVAGGIILVNRKPGTNR